MPELPEVEVLVRHLRPLLQGKTIAQVDILRRKVLKPTPPHIFKKSLCGATFQDLCRRGKYLLFYLAGPHGRTFPLIGHLGMTGRMYLHPTDQPLPKHAAVVFRMGELDFVFEDTRFFGRLTLNQSPVENLGPEPLGEEFRAETLAVNLRKSRRPIKVLLLDQHIVAGIGNIYASEALFLARLDPRKPACRLTKGEVQSLWKGIRVVLRHAVARGSTIPLNYSGTGNTENDGLFYFGSAAGPAGDYKERLRVYGRVGQPCLRCKHVIAKCVQAARSTYYCPGCQTAAARKRTKTV